MVGVMHYTSTIILIVAEHALKHKYCLPNNVCQSLKYVFYKSDLTEKNANGFLFRAMILLKLNNIVVSFIQEVNMNNMHTQYSEEFCSLPPFTTENLYPNIFLRDSGPQS